MYVAKIGTKSIAGEHTCLTAFSETVTQINHSDSYLLATFAHESIRDADALAICNHRAPIDLSTTAQILNAMLHNKPIIFFEPPVFSTDVPLFNRQVITQRLSKFMIGDLSAFDETDAHDFIPPLISEHVNYVLTKHERVLMRALIRAHFRSLLAAQILK